MAIRRYLTVTLRKPGWAVEEAAIGVNISFVV